MVYYVYEEEFNGKPSSGAAKCFGLGDYLIGITSVCPTENSSEEICEIYRGELSEPLNPCIEEYMQHYGFVRLLTNAMSLEEFKMLPRGI